MFRPTFLLMDVAYHINFDGSINLTTGWKEFVAESGFEDGDVVWLCSPGKMTL